MQWQFSLMEVETTIKEMQAFLSEHYFVDDVGTLISCPDVIWIDAEGESL